MADIDHMEITLTVGFSEPTQEKVYRARANIADCERATGSSWICPICVERAAAIAALEAGEGRK
jgi:hypothetical protein